AGAAVPSNTIPGVSSQSQAAAAAHPDESGAELADRLLSELDVPRTGPLAEFTRAYVRRMSVALISELDAAELAAQVGALFEFMSARRPGELAVRVYTPDRARDGYHGLGSV